jgi:hypothetical protein
MKPILFALLFCTSTLCQALTIEQAYAAIPHQRTLFDARASTLGPVKVAALQRLFALADRGTVLRVEGWQALHAGDARDLARVLGGYAALLSELARAGEVAELAAVQNLVQQAVQQHQGYFAAKAQAGPKGGKFDTTLGAPISQASQKLHQAYGMLMQQYAREPAVNKSAFFDYLCALDFL